MFHRACHAMMGAATDHKLLIVPQCTPVTPAEPMRDARERGQLLAIPSFCRSLPQLRHIAAINPNGDGRWRVEPYPCVERLNT
jgi:hypothetical protein